MILTEQRELTALASPHFAAMHVGIRYGGNQGVKQVSPTLEGDCAAALGTIDPFAAVWTTAVVGSVARLYVDRQVLHLDATVTANSLLHYGWAWFFFNDSHCHYAFLRLLILTILGTILLPSGSRR
jgi:hypothetical protein